MVASPARIDANRRNAQLSTGPRTPEGKARSRANAITHGLCSTVVDHPDDPQGPPTADGLDGWLQGQLALACSKIERCQAIERAARARVVARASLTWDEDRRLDAVRLGSRLAGRPEETVARLRESLQGCEWLLARWAMLAHAADSQAGIWTPDQSRMALDLLATPAEFREGYPPGTSIDFDGSLVGPTPGPAAVARLAIDELTERVGLLLPLDQSDRERAEADLSDDDPGVKRLRRYEAELFRRVRWSLGQLPGPSGAVEPAEAPAAEPGSNPMPGPIATRMKPITPPPSPVSRVDRRLLKAESRREAKRRKREHPRA